MQNTFTFSPDSVLACIHAALPPQRQNQRNLPGLAKRLSNLVLAEHLPDRLDAWRSMTT